MSHMRKNSIHRHFLRRPSSDGKASKGSMAMMGGGSNTRVKSGGSDAPAVAVDHKHYYRDHHAAARAATEPSIPTAATSSTLAGLEFHGTPPWSKYKIPFPFTQTGPSTKATGIRRPGPRTQAATPRVADHRERQTEHSPRSSWRRSSGTDHRQQQTDRSNPGGIRRSPREASPPNFSRKTTPSPQQGRSRSNSKTEDVPTTVYDAVAKEEDQKSQDGGFTLQAKTYQPPGSDNISTISDNQSQQSHSSLTPSTLPESATSTSGFVTSRAPSRTDSDVTRPSPNTTPSSSPVEKQLGSPYSRKVSSGSASKGHIPRELSPKTLRSLFDRELPALPATTYEPPVCAKTDTKAQKKALTAYSREPATKKQGHEPARRPINSPLPLKRALSPSPSAAPPLPALPSNPTPEAKANSAAVTPVQSQETISTNKEFGLFFTIHPENNIIEEVSPSSVQSRIKHALKMAANTTKEEHKVSISDPRSVAHKREDREPGAANEASQDAELQKLMEEVDTVFRGLATTRVRRGKASPNGRAKIGAAPIAAGDVNATSGLLPLSPEEMRRSRRVDPLNLSKERKEIKESSRPEPSPSNANNETARKGGSASSRTPRRATPRTPPPSCRSSNQSGISRPGQDSPSKGGREEGKRFDALKRREEFLKYEGGVF
ncbi:hypothetical protein PG984_004824 [Apiospora sp. TS-2023a]